MPKPKSRNDAPWLEREVAEREQAIMRVAQRRRDDLAVAHVDDALRGAASSSSCVTTTIVVPSRSAARTARSSPRRCARRARRSARRPAAAPAGSRARARSRRAAARRRTAATAGGARALREPDVVEQLARALAPLRAGQPRFGHRQLDVLARRERRHQVEALEDEADVAQPERRSPRGRASRSTRSPAIDTLPDVGRSIDAEQVEQRRSCRSPTARRSRRTRRCATSSDTPRSACTRSSPMR